jgi:hypothetical protein
MFRHEHTHITANIAVPVVRVKGDEAWVLFGSSTLPAEVIVATREGHTWKIGQTLGHRLP